MERKLIDSVLASQSETDSNEQQLSTVHVRYSDSARADLHRDLAHRPKSKCAPVVTEAHSFTSEMIAV